MAPSCFRSKRDLVAPSRHFPAVMERAAGRQDLLHFSSYGANPPLGQRVLPGPDAREPKDFGLMFGAGALARTGRRASRSLMGMRPIPASFEALGRGFARDRVNVYRLRTKLREVEGSQRYGVHVLEPIIVTGANRTRSSSLRKIARAMASASSFSKTTARALERAFAPVLGVLGRNPSAGTPCISGAFSLRTRSRRWATR